MSASLQRIRREVIHADTIGGMGATVEERDRSAVTRAFAYVWIAASLERFVSDALQYVLLELNARSPAHHAIRPSLFALLGDGMLDSIARRKRNASWSTKVAMFELLQSAAPASFAPVLPLDGRTLRREHFENMWVVFGFQGASLPSPAHAPALTELADGRNKVAHGNEDPVVFGRAKVGADVVRLLTRIDDIGVHLTLAIDDYLSRSAFNR